MLLAHFIETSFSLGLFANAILFIPQSLRLIKTKNAKEISFVTFFGFLLIQLATVLHAFLHQDYLLALGTMASMLTCGWVVWLVLYYRMKKY